MKRYGSISIAANEDEKLIVETLAKNEGIQPSTLARQILYRGLEEFLKDQKFRGQLLEGEIFQTVTEMVERDAALQKAKAAVLVDRENKAREKAAKKPPLSNQANN